MAGVFPNRAEPSMDPNQLNKSSTPGQPGLPRPGRSQPRTPLQPSREVDWDSLPDAFLPSGNDSRVHGATESPLARTQPIPLPLPQPALPFEPKRSLAAVLPPIAPQPLPAGSLPRPLPRIAARPAPLTPPQPLPKPVVASPDLGALTKPAPIPVAAPAQPVMPRPLPVAAPVVAKPQPVPSPVPVVVAIPRSIPEPVPAPAPKPLPAPPTAASPVRHLSSSASLPAPIASRKTGAKAPSDAPDDASDAVNPIRAAICGAIPSGVNPILASVIAPPHLVDQEDDGPERESRSSYGLLRLAVSGLVAASLAVAAYAYYGNGFDQAGLQKTAANAERVLRRSLHHAQQRWEETRAACQILLAVAFPQQPTAGATAARPAAEREHLAGRLKSEIGGFVQTITSRSREDWNAAKGSKR